MAKRTPRACASSSTAAIAPCANCATPAAVRAIGLGVNEWEVCVELLEHCELDCILLAGRYTLLEQPALEKLLPLCVAAPRFHHLRRAVQLGHPRRRLARRRAGALQLRAAAGRGARARAPARSAVRGVRRAAAGRGAAVSAGASGRRQRGRRLRQRAQKRAIAPRCSRIPSRREFWRALRDRGLVDARAPLPAIAA